MRILEHSPAFSVCGVSGPEPCVAGRSIETERFGPPPCAPTNGRPGFPFGFLGAGGRLPKARRGRVFIEQLIHHYRDQTMRNRPCLCGVSSVEGGGGGSAGGDPADSVVSSRTGPSVPGPTALVYATARES